MKNSIEPIKLIEIIKPLIKFLNYLISSNGREWLNAFNRFLRKEAVWLTQDNWEVWRFAKIGMNKTFDQFIKLMILNGYGFRPDTGFPNYKLYTVDTLRSIGLNFRTEECDIYFVSITPRQLGLHEGFSVKELLDASSIRGLDVCFSGDLFELIAQGYCSLSENESFRFLTKTELNPNSDYFFLLIEYQEGDQVLSFEKKKIDSNHGLIVTHLDTQHIFSLRKRTALSFINTE